MVVAAEKPKNADAAAVALLKWILAGLLLLNGTALVVAARMGGVHGGLLGGFRSDYAVGLLCALLGGLCWVLSNGAIPKQDCQEEQGTARPEQGGSRDRAIAFGALAIMLWVASLTTFVTGCERLSWSPAGDRDAKVLHSAGRTDGHRNLSG